MKFGDVVLVTEAEEGFRPGAPPYRAVIEEVYAPPREREGGEYRARPLLALPTDAQPTFALRRRDRVDPVVLRGRVFVGRWERMRQHDDHGRIFRCSFLDHAHPTEFAELLCSWLEKPESERGIWLNNPVALDWMHSQYWGHVLCLGPDGPRPLSEHKDAERWRGIMSAGEYWSCVGEDWKL